MADIDSQKIAKHQKQLTQLESRQEENSLELKFLQNMKDVVDAARHRSNIWIEQYEEMLPNTSQARARLFSIRDRQDYASHEFEQAHGCLLEENKSEAQKILRDREDLIEANSKSIQMDQEEGV